MFPTNYFESRSKFRDLALQLACQLDDFPIDARGPNDETLTIDVAKLIGTQFDASRPTLMVTSGLHGVEGYLGAAIQLEMMSRWLRDGPPADFNIVLAHGLNPYGFAHSRRFDDHNVDLNRNYLRKDESYSQESKSYQSFHRLLNPETPRSMIDAFYLKAAYAIARYGYRNAAQAIATGQYQHSRGLFFGGNQPSETTRILQQQLHEWVGQSRRVLHIDIHSGLGKRGEIQLLLDQPFDAGQKTELQKAFGDSCLSFFDGGTVLYRAQGGYGSWCVEQLADREYVYFCAETGTYPSLKVLAGLRAENRALHWAPDDTKQLAQTRKQLIELFCPNDARWRNQVLQRGCEIIQQAFAYGRRDA